MELQDKQYVELTQFIQEKIAVEQRTQLLGDEFRIYGLTQLRQIVLDEQEMQFAIFDGQSMHVPLDKK